MSRLSPIGIWIADPHQSVTVGTPRDYYVFDVRPAVLGAPPVDSGVKDVNVPHDQPQLSKTGKVSTSAFYFDWYNRIHVFPGELALGNLLSTQTRDLVLWNSNLTTQTLLDVDYPLGQGFALTSPVATPYDMLPLKYLTFEAQITVEGTPTISLDVTFTVEAVDRVVPVSGQRVIVWPFPPNWRDGLDETLEWSTAITRSRNAKEQRRSLRRTPRRTIEYRSSLRRYDSILARNMLHGWQARFFAVPLWHERTNLVVDTPAGSSSFYVVDTEGRTFVVGMNIVVMQDAKTYETLEVSDIVDDQLFFTKPTERDWPIGTRVYPAMIAKLQQAVNTVNETDEVSQVSTTWLGQQGDTDANAERGTPPAVYRGIEVYEKHPNWSEKISTSLQEDSRLVDFLVSKFAVEYGSSLPTIAYTMTLAALNRPAIVALRQFFARRRGRTVPSWMPSFMADLKPVETVAPNAVVIRFENNGYAQFLADNDARRDIRITMKTGAKYLRRVLEAEILSTDEMLLTLDTGIPVALGPDTVKTIQMLSLLRLGGDAVTFRYESDSVATAQTTFVITRNE